MTKDSYRDISLYITEISNICVKIMDILLEECENEKKSEQKVE